MYSDVVRNLGFRTRGQLIALVEGAVRSIKKIPVVSVGGLLIVPAVFLGQNSVDFAESAEEISFIFNTFSFLVWGALVMWMCAGFTMLESGSVRTKNASMICLKNIGLYSIAGLAFFFIGYNLMYVDVGDFIGPFNFMYGPSSDEIALLDGNQEALAAVLDQGHSTMSECGRFSYSRWS